MKIGLSLLLWTTHLKEDEFHLVEDLKEVGYDGVEVPVFEGEPEHYARLAERIRALEMDVTAVTPLPDEGHNAIGPDEQERENALDYLKRSVDRARALGSSLLCGPFHQPLGQFTGDPPTEEEKKRGADVHRRAAEYAAEHDIVLAIEYLNRFECYFLNTLEDSAEYVKRVDHPNFKTMYDTFHANIEEKHPIDIVEKHIDVVEYIHLSENDRGTPGRGHFDFASLLKTLRGNGYDGWITIEAFGRALPDLAAATCVWREFFPSYEQVYTEGYQLVKQLWEEAGN